MFSLKCLVVQAEDLISGPTHLFAHTLSGCHSGAAVKIYSGSCGAAPLRSAMSLRITRRQCWQGTTLTIHVLTTATSKLAAKCQFTVSKTLKISRQAYNWVLSPRHRFRPNMHCPRPRTINALRHCPTHAVRGRNVSLCSGFNEVERSNFSWVSRQSESSL